MTFPTFADWMNSFLPKSEPEPKPAELATVADWWLASMAPAQTLMQSFTAPAVPPVALGNAAMQTAAGNLFGLMLGWQQTMQETLTRAGVPAPLSGLISGAAYNPFAAGAFMPGWSWPVSNGAAAEASAMVDHSVKSMAATAKTQMDSMSSMVGKASKAAESQLEQATAMMADTQDKLNEVAKKNVAKATAVLSEASDVIGEATRTQVVKATAIMNDASDAAASQMKTAKTALEQASGVVAKLGTQSIAPAKDLSRKIADTKIGGKTPAKPVASKKVGGPLPLPKSLTSALAVAPDAAKAVPVPSIVAVRGASAAKPKGLAKARGGKPDDLKLIAGIGPKIEAILNGLGFFHYEQLASWDALEIEWIDGHLKFSGRVMRDNWVGQAKALAAGGRAEHARQFGKVPH